MSDPASTRAPAFGRVVLTTFHPAEVWVALESILAAIGYFDTSKLVDRYYYHSMYFRIPGGVMFEAATTDIGFGIDGEPGHFGVKFQLPLWLADRERELLNRLEPISFNHAL